MNSDNKPHICIIGGGFAGLKAAQHINSDRFRVTLVDPSPCMEWLPNIHEIISGKKKSEDLRLDRQRLIKRLGHHFELAKTVSVGESSVQLADGRKLSFDACIVSVGGISNSLDIPGAASHAIGMKSIADCQRIHDKLCKVTRSEKSVRISVVGAGIEGIETLGELLRKYRHNAKVEILVTDRNNRVLSSCAEKLEPRIRKRVRKYNVDFALGRSVTEVREDGLVLDDGQFIRSDVTIWSAGAVSNRLLLDSGFATGPGGGALVNEWLQSEQYPNVFVIGDAASTPEPLAKQAYHAIDMGKRAGLNAVRLCDGKALKRYKIQSKPQIISFGDLDTFVVFKDLSVSSAVLGIGKEAVYNVGMIQLSPPKTVADFFRKQNMLRKSTMRVYLPATNPIKLAKQLPRLRVKL